MSKKSTLKLYNYSLSIGKIEILKDISLEFFPGEIVLLYGPRNSGKSSLLRSFVQLNKELYNNVNGIGGIFFQGKDAKVLDKKILRSQIIYCDPTFINNLDFLTLKEFLYFSLEININDLSEINYDILEKLNLSHIFSNINSIKKYNNLSNWSIGEKIALLTFCSLSRNPKVFIFDSLLDHLDDFLLNSLKEILFKIKEDKTLIISSRNLTLFSDISDKIAYINEGRIKFFGDTGKFMLSYPK